MTCMVFCVMYVLPIVQLYNLSIFHFLLILLSGTLYGIFLKDFFGGKVEYV